MKNTTTDLNDILFCQLERLNEEDLIDDFEKLDHEIKRAQTMGKVAEKVIKNAEVTLKAIKIKDELMDERIILPSFLDNKKLEAK